jgi:hypothetical protein
VTDARIHTTTPRELWGYFLNGPILALTLADTTEDNTEPSASVRTWLTDHGWHQDESIGWICGDHRH